MSTSDVNVRAPQLSERGPIPAPHLINSTPQSVNWGLTGIAIGLTAGRYLIRAGSPGRFHWDDTVHGAALAVLVAHGATNQITGDAKTTLATLTSAKPPPPDAQLLAQYQRTAQLNTANNCLLYLVFWLVKVAFLLFYRLLFGSNRKFRIAWWIVLAFTLLTFWAPIAGVLATCAGASSLADYKACNGQNNFRIAKLVFSCVVNVVSDVAVMVLPLWMLRTLQLQKRQKAGLAVVFSLATFTVVLDILRTAMAVQQQQALYTVLEINFAVIVSCLPTFQALLVLRRRLRQTPTPYYSGSGVSGRRKSGVGKWAGELAAKAKPSPFTSQGSTVRPERNVVDPVDLEYGMYNDVVKMGTKEPQKNKSTVVVTKSITVEEEHDPVARIRAETVVTPLGQRRSEALVRSDGMEQHQLKAAEEERMTVYPYPSRASEE